VLRRLLRKHLNQKQRKYFKIGIIVLGVIIIGSVICSTISSKTDYTDEFVQKQKVEEIEKDYPGAKLETLPERKLVKIPKAGEVGGVLAGIAYYLGISLWLVRVIFILGLMIWKDSEYLILIYVLLYFYLPWINYIPEDFIMRTM